MEHTHENLPTSPALLQHIILQLQSELSIYKAKYIQLLEEIRLSKQQRFSPSSEKNLLQADLFIEADARKQCLSHQERYILRQNKAPPILDIFKKWLTHYLTKTAEQGKLGKAIRYALGNWTELIHYLEDGCLEIDNNRIENAIRPFAVGRKNWLFSGSPSGAKAGAILYSLIEACKANRIEPYQYFCAMLHRIRDCQTDEDYRQLLPQFIQLR